MNVYSPIHNFRNVRSRTILVLVTIMLATLLIAPIAKAGKEGVYLAENTYFTLEQVSFAAGTDQSLLKFVLRLHNGSTQDVDFNYYGARVTDSQGRSYSVQQVNKQNARVLPGKDQDFQYTAKTPSTMKAEDLKVTLFAWDYSQANYMNDLGSLSVHNAMQEGGVTAAQANVSLNQVDSSLAADASITFSLTQSYLVYQSDSWNIYTDLLLTNPGSSTVAIPSALKMQLANASGQHFAAAVVQGTGQSLLPGTSRKLTLQTTLADVVPEDQSWSLELYKDEANDQVILAALGLPDAAKSIQIGAEEAITGADGKKLFSSSVDSVVLSSQEDGLLVQAAVKVSNSSNRVVALPFYTAEVQMKDVGLTVAANQTAALPAYLNPQGTAVYTFHAVLPNGITAEELQLVLFEKKAKGTAANSAERLLPVMITALDQATEQNGVTGHPYVYGDSLNLEAGPFTPASLDTSLVDLKLYTNESSGYQTAIAKVKLTNNGSTNLPIPTWNTELISSTGLLYSGTLTKTTEQQIAPNTSYLVTYSYLVPVAKDETSFTWHVYDNKTAAPAKITLGAYQLQLSKDSDSKVFAMYPYQLTIKDFSVFYVMLPKAFNFEFKVDMDVSKLEPIISDASASKLQLELVDYDGKVLATQSLDFAGIQNGSQVIKFTNDQISQFSPSYIIKVYESVQTTTGSVKRLLAELQDIK